MFAHGGTAAAANWWEAGGATAVVAYQAKGAASYAASLSNLANPGTYDLTEGDAPNWDTTTGWQFVPNDYLISCNHNLAPYFIVRYANAASEDRTVVGCAETSLVGVRPNSFAYTWVANGSIGWSYNNTYRWTPASTSAVVGMGDTKVWLNGSNNLTFANGMTTQARALWIGGKNGKYDNTYFDGYILAYAGYNTISDSQFVAVSEAMAAL